MFNLEHLIQSGGILLVALIVFAESGLLIGFALPGDTLLFSAGLLASQGQFNIYALCAAIIVAAILGDNVGYSIGQKLGPRIFTKKDGLLFRAEYVERSHAFFEKHGGKTVTLARFVPVIRTFAPMIAGASNMPRKNFFRYNIVGGILWGAGVTLLGFFVGGLIPNAKHYVEPIMMLAVFLTLIPSILHILRDPKARAHMLSSIKKPFAK